MRNKHKVFRIVLFLGALVLLFAACAQTIPIEECVTDEPYGFWRGLLHGVISPVGLIVSLFKEDVAMYAINNNGGWYDFGFLLGAIIIFGGGGKASN